MVMLSLKKKLNLAMPLYNSYSQNVLIFRKCIIFLVNRIKFFLLFTKLIGPRENEIPKRRQKAVKLNLLPHCIHPCGNNK